MCYFAGDLAEARTHCERALDSCDPQHEEDARQRYGEYTATLATAFLALTNWQLGEADRARELIAAANRRAADLGHVPSMANPLFWRSNIEILRGDAAAALSAAEALKALSHEYGMTQWRVMAEASAGWARGRLHDPAGGAAELRGAVAALVSQGGRLAVPFFAGCSRSSKRKRLAQTARSRASTKL
jgi:hypothetical protein